MGCRCERTLRFTELQNCAHSAPRSHTKTPLRGEPSSLPLFAPCRPAHFGGPRPPTLPLFLSFFFSLSLSFSLECFPCCVGLLVCTSGDVRGPLPLRPTAAPSRERFPSRPPTRAQCAPPAGARLPRGFPAALPPPLLRRARFAIPAGRRRVPRPVLRAVSWRALLRLQRFRATPPARFRASACPWRVLPRAFRARRLPPMSLASSLLPPLPPSLARARRRAVTRGGGGAPPWGCPSAWACR